MQSIAKSYILKPAFLVIALALGSCSTNPGSGPLTDDVNNRIQTENAPAYELVPLNPATVKILHTHEPKGLAGVFTDRRPPASIVFGIGDVGWAISSFPASRGCRSSVHMLRPSRSARISMNSTSPRSAASLRRPGPKPCSSRKAR